MGISNHGPRSSNALFSRRREAIAIAAVALATALARPVSADGRQTQPQSEFKPLAAEPAVHDGLVDCRSPVIEHERRVALGEAWKIGDATLEFTLDGETLAVAIATPDAGPSTQQLDDLPALLRIKAFGQAYGLSVRLDRDGKHVRLASAFGLAVPVGRKTAYLVDSNLDGQVGSAGDGLVAPDSKTVGPVKASTTEIWSLTGAVAVRRGGERWLTADLDMPQPADPDHGAAWRQIQWHRQACGVMPLRYQGALEKGMREHIAYMLRNRLRTHYEQPNLPGYSREGARAGATCLIGFEKPSYRVAVRSQLTTLFHRNSLLAPDLAASAMLLEKKTFMVSTRAAMGGPLRGRVLVYPGHGMTNVPCEFNIAGEIPCPFEGPVIHNRKGPGIGIKLEMMYWLFAMPEPPTLTLESIDAAGDARAVDVDVYYPGQIPESRGLTRNYSANIAAIPKRFLRPNTRHRARVAAQLPVALKANRTFRFERFDYEWHFTTGSRSRR
jgi:hypothetical protein